MNQFLREPLLARHSRYSEYRPTSQGWVGSIPSHWSTKKTSWVFQLTGSGTTPSSGNDAYFAGEIPWVNTGDLNDDLVTEPARFVTSAALHDHSALKLYPAGTVLIALYGATIGKLGILGFPATVNQACFAMGEPVGIRPKFAFYWFLGNREQLVSLSYGGGQPNISGEIVRQVRLSVPPIEEQEQIVRFLDRETAKFDALIAKKQRLIELLQEKRTALISHAVTQGLDPGGPKKESGIEWLGKIPSHWTVHRIATIASKITNGYVGPTRDIFVPEGTRYLQSLHIKSGSILFERGPYYVTDSWSKRHPKSILRVGDVLIVQTGAEVGQCAVVGQEYAGSNCHALIIISPKPHYIIGGFLGAVIRSSYGRSLLEHVQTGALHPHLNCTHVRTLPIPCPPLADQGLILKDLEIRSARLDALLRTVEAGIERVWEYRTALISAAVTGKIDVRGEVE